MADGGLTAEYRCAYCYQEFQYMTEPKELPCHHVFCLTCLQGTLEEDKNVSCPTCQTIHELQNLTEFPTVKLDATEVADTSTTLMCDCFNCEGQIAICYCLYCKHRFCSIHHEMHRPLFGDSHETISISVYASFPGKYKTVKCDCHGKEFDKACEKCDKLVCNNCDLYEGQCKDEKEQHVFRSLDQLTEQMSAHFKRLLKLASDKLTEICKEDKRIWRILDEEEMQCKEKIALIERNCEEQIVRIRQDSEKLKKEIYEYQRTLTGQTEEHNTKLMAQKVELEGVCKQLHRLLKDGHVTDQILQNEMMTQEMLKNIYVELGHEPTTKPVLIAKAEKAVLDIRLSTFPTSLTFSSELVTASPCYSAYHRHLDRMHRSLLVGCRTGVALINEKNTIDYQTLGDVMISISNVAVEYGKHIYVLHTAGSCCTVKVYSLNLALIEVLCTFEQTTMTPAFLAVSDRYIVATPRNSKQLILYSFLSQRKLVLQTDIVPRVVYFLPNGDLLVTGHSTHNLTRYQIENDKLSVVWTCQNLDDAHGVCTDESGLIYVMSHNKKILYIISSYGQILKSITHRRFPQTRTGQISVKGDQLAVPGWDNKLYLFKLNY